MTYPPEVHWAEGEFLSQQHLQRFSRFLQGRIDAVNLRARPYNWGVIELEVDETALENQEFKVHRLEAVLENGLWVRVPEDGEIPVRDLTDAFQSGGEVLDVFLAIPERQEQSSNVASAKNPDLRFRIVEESVRDENTGDDPRPIKMRQLNARIILGREKQEGYHLLRLTRLGPVGEVEPKPALVSSFVPPARRIGASSSLCKQLDDINKGIAATAKGIADRFRDRPINWNSAEETEVAWKLHVMNSNLAVLRTYAEISDYHPLEVFVAYARVAGELGFFSRDRLCADLPIYDHRDIQNCFNRLGSVIRELLVTGRQVEPKRLKFELGHKQRTCNLTESWVQLSNQYYFALESKGLDEEAARGRTRALKLASPSTYSQIKDQRLAGIRLTPIRSDDVTTKLPWREGLFFWSIDTESSLWQSCLEDMKAVLFDGQFDDPEVEFYLYSIPEVG